MINNTGGLSYRCTYSDVVIFKQHFL